MRGWTEYAFNDASVKRSEPGTAVSIVSDYGGGQPGDRGSIPGRGERIFSVASVSKPPLGLTQPPVQWVPGDPFPGAEARPGRDDNHSPPPYSVEVKNE
jgi:hypothetical protein